MIGVGAGQMWWTDADMSTMSNSMIDQTPKASVHSRNSIPSSRNRSSARAKRGHLPGESINFCEVNSDAFISTCFIMPWLSSKECLFY